MFKTIGSEISAAVLTIAVCLLVGFLGSLLTMPSIPTWYVALNKPVFNPPNWIFGPVWTTLYILMGISAYLILRQGLSNRRVILALSLFSLQLLLNLEWSLIFFARHNIGLAFGEIILLWLMILFTAFYFYRLSKAAGWLFLPYILWVSFAAVLNFSIWMLNP
jgi:tryptophan-rich sensory protein